MSALTVTGRFNAALLSEELVAAFPQLIDRSLDPPEARFAMSYDGKTLRFKSEARLDEKALQTVVSAHDPNGKSRNEKRADRQAALEASIRTKLLGLGFTGEEIGFLAEFLESAASASRRA